MSERVTRRDFIRNAAIAVSLGAGGFFLGKSTTNEAEALNQVRMLSLEKEGYTTFLGLKPLSSYSPDALKQAGFRDEGNKVADIFNFIDTKGPHPRVQFIWSRERRYGQGNPFNQREELIEVPLEEIEWETNRFLKQGTEEPAARAYAFFTWEKLPLINFPFFISDASLEANTRGTPDSLEPYLTGVTMMCQNRIMYELAKFFNSDQLPLPAKKLITWDGQRI